MDFESGPGQIAMSDFVLRVGSYSVQGVRPNNEDRYVADPKAGLFLVADGMGGQERGEVASEMAVEIIPKVVQDRLGTCESVEQAVAEAFEKANHAILEASQSQPAGRRMGTTAVCALHCNGKVYVAGLGDSRAYLVRGHRVELLTIDHSVAYALMLSGALTEEEARHSPLQNVLHKFLGCANMREGTEVKPFTPEAGDRLLLGSDGLTNHISPDDLILGGKNYTDPQEWAEFLVKTALDRGSRDNVTCVVVYFDPS